MICAEHFKILPFVPNKWVQIEKVKVDCVSIEIHQLLSPGQKRQKPSLMRDGWREIDRWEGSMTRKRKAVCESESHTHVVLEVISRQILSAMDPFESNCLLNERETEGCRMEISINADFPCKWASFLRLGSFLRINGTQIRWTAWVFWKMLSKKLWLASFF